MTRSATVTAHANIALAKYWGKSDIDAGWEIGRRVGEAVVERAKRDGS